MKRKQPTKTFMMISIEKPFGFHGLYEGISVLQGLKRRTHQHERERRNHQIHYFIIAKTQHRKGEHSTLYVFPSDFIFERNLEMSYLLLWLGFLENLSYLMVYTL